jgi:hypothetical protein
MHRRLLPLGFLAVAGAITGLAALASSTPTARAQQTESVELFRGCNNVSLTWANGTPTTMVSAAITPASNIISIWRFNNLQQTFQGFSPQFVQQSDLQTVNRIDAVFICMTGPGTMSRPILGASGSTTTTALASPTVAATVPGFVQTRILPGATTATRGSTVTVSVQTTPNTSCSGFATAPNGQPTSLGQSIANASGIAVLSWQVPTNSTTGTATVQITCGAGTAQTGTVQTTITIL